MMLIGYYSSRQDPPCFDPQKMIGLLGNLREPLYLLEDAANQRLGLASGGELEPHPGQATCYPVLACLGPLYPEWLGDRAFTRAHRLRFPYLAGSMAHGIASAELVIAIAKMGSLGFFGSAGLSTPHVEKQVLYIKETLAPLGLPWGANLIHSPALPWLERDMVELYLKLGVRRVEASAFFQLEPTIVYYGCKGLYRNSQGIISRSNHIIAKLSREEVARPFLMPAPEAILDKLLHAQKITPEEYELARQVPIADDITVEADSGGHTDNRPLSPLFYAISHLRDEMSARYGYHNPVRIGAAGGLGTPHSLAAAFALGAAYVLVGSVHQSCRESGLSDEGKKLLAQASIADVMMTVSADMFETGVKVQVLKKGILMGVRANQLYDLYTRYASLEEIPPEIVAGLEKNLFRRPIGEIWVETLRYFASVDPQQIALAERDPRHKMALVFRWYLGHTSRWPILGTPDRRLDYQIWCGPAMGAFNAWVKGSFLEPVENRSIPQVALNLLEGAAYITRLQQARSCGLPLPTQAFHYAPAQLS